MGEEEHLLAFLDDVFIVSEPDRTRSSHFGSRPWLKTSIASAWWVRCFVVSSSFLRSGKTWLHAAQGIEHRSGAGRVAASHPRSSPAVREVAGEGEGSRSSSCSESSAISSDWVCAASEEVTGCRERCNWRDQEFGGCHRPPRACERARQAFVDCAQSSSGEVEGGSHSRALGFMQAVHRASQEACDSCRRSDRQGCRAESSFRSGSCTGRTTSCSAPGRSSWHHPCSGSRARSGQGVADTDRSSGAGARCTEVCTTQAGWWWRRECRMVGKRSSMFGEHSTDAHVRSAGSGKVDVRPKLRSSERHRVRRSIIDLEDWRSGGSRGWAARDFESRCVDGRPFEIFSDVIVDRDGRCQKTLRHRRGRLCQWPVSVTIQARYGFRGVRVGEASHPGPPRRRNRSEDSADVVLTSLEAALTRLDDSDDEQPIVPTWRDIDSGTEGHGGRSVRVRIGDVASPVASVPPSSLLDSLEGVLLEDDVPDQVPPEQRVSTAALVVADGGEGFRELPRRRLRLVGTLFPVTDSPFYMRSCQVTTPSQASHKKSSLHRR